MNNKPFIKGLAYEYGVKAFKKGLPSVPARDRKFLDDFLTGNKVGNPNTIKYLKEWTKGWHEANLKAEY